MSTIGNVEIDISNGGYGGDFSLTSTGDLKLAIDTDSSIAATVQRLYRLICSDAFLQDAEGNIIAYPTDKFNWNYGATLSGQIGEPFDDTFRQNVSSRVIAALTTDPGVLKFPSPTVAIQDGGNGKALITPSCSLKAGRRITLPTIPLVVGS